MDKQNLRSKYNSLRNNISTKDKTIWDEVLCQKLLNYIIQSKPKIVHTYLPLGSEINFYPVIDYLLNQNIKVVCPKTLDKPLLQHLILNSLEHLEDGKFGTKFPSGENGYNGNYDLIIVPGLAYNSQNYRLGYGGGYYDHFLKSQPKAVKLGLFYSFQLNEELSVERHDVPLDLILTDISLDIISCY